MYFACYKFGAWLLGEQSLPIRFEISWQWAMTTLVEIWQPLLLGCFVEAAELGIGHGQRLGMLEAFLLAQHLASEL